MTSHSSRVSLSVNVNKVALLRNSRHLGIPSVTRAALLCLQAGAQGITIHPRPDERHIRASDVPELTTLMQAWPDREFNIEGNPFHNLMDHVRAVRPHQVTFVPDSEGQFTSDHGWLFPQDADRLKPLIDECKALGVRVSLFMDPIPEQMAAARAVGADRVELYTEPYAASWGTAQQRRAAAALRRCGRGGFAGGLGLERRARSQPRQFGGLCGGSERLARSVDWPCFHGRCTGVGLHRHGAGVPGLPPKMIYGIGTDICDIRRIQASLNRHGERFAAKVLSDAEMATWKARSARWPERGVRYLATRFSAKEAFSKAIGLGMRMPMTWRLCEIGKLPSGQPVIVLHGGLKDWFDAKGLSAHITVTDESEYAASFCVVETHGSSAP